MSLRSNSRATYGHRYPAAAYSEPAVLGRRGFTAAALTVPALFAISACSGSSDASSGTGEPQDGGELVVGLQSIGQLDPQQGGNNDDVAIQRQLVASLTISDPESPGTVKPWVAAEWTVNDDASEYEFVLRSDATFADDTPIDAESVKANFEALIDLGVEAAVAGQLLEGAEIEAVDTDRVRITFPSPNVQFLEATSTSTLGLISTDSTKLSVEERQKGEFVGSGPFRLAEYTANEEAILEKVADYALATEVHDHEGEAHLDRIVFKQIAENGVRSGSLSSDDIQVATFLTTPELTSLESTPGFTVISRTNPGTVFRFIPKLEEDTPLRDIAVRRAIQKGIDRDEVAQIVYGEDAEPAQSLLAETTPLFTDLHDLLARDVEGATQLLEDAGWTAGSGGIREKDGEQLSLNVTFWQASDPLVVVQRQLKDIGVDLQVNQVSVSEAEAQSGKSDFDYGNVSRNEPDRLRNDFLETFQGWADLDLPEDEAPDLDDLVDGLRTQLGVVEEDERKSLIADIQTTIIDDGYAIPVYTLISSIALSESVHGLALDGTSRLDFYDAWLDQA